MSPSGTSLRRVVTLALIVGAVSFSLPVSTQQRPSARSSRGARRHVWLQGREAADGEVLVKFREQRGPEQRGRIEMATDADESEAVDRRGLRRMHSRRMNTAALLTALRMDPDVEYAEPNYVLRSTSTTPNDPQFTNLWGLFNTGFNTVGGGGLAGADIDVLSAWDTTTGSRSNVVGVIDTGVDYNHPDLAANIWSAPAQFQVSIGGQTITCQAGTHGFNAINRTCDPADDNNHGTHVSGTIGAVGNNGVGLVGVNWIASIMGLKFLGAGGSGYTDDAIAAIEFAIQAKTRFGASANVRILSNSWGGGGSTALLNAINSAAANDMLFVAAAGNSHTNNDAQPFYPAAYTAPNMVTVASSDSADHLSSFSNYGATTVHLAAPGTAIYSTTRANTYSTFQGTSMATPHVSGAAALVLSACVADTATLKALLLNNVDLVTAFSGITTTGGRLNVQRTLHNCQYPRVSSVTMTANKTAPQVPNTAITFTASATGGEAPLQYRWYVSDGATTTMSDWGTSTTFVWTPTQANSAYQVHVRARSAWSSVGAEAISAAQAFPIQSRVTAVTLTPSVASPQGLGTTVTWTATPTGGVAPYQYKWSVSDGSTSVILADWTSAASYVWTPTAANAGYVMTVKARSVGNAGSYEALADAAYVIKPKVTGLTMTSDKAPPQVPNTAVTFTASATGGEAPLQYRWYVSDGATTTMSDWGTSTTFVWTPTQANSAYQVHVRARSAWSSLGAEAISAAQAFPIQARVTAVSLTPNLSSPQAVGATVTWTAAPTGGTAPYQYKWSVSDGATSVILADWSSAAVYAWTPTVANASYVLTVKARSAGNAGSYEALADVAYALKPKVTALTMTTDKVPPQAQNTAITFTANATGGEAPLQYRWYVSNGATTTMSDWGTSATFVWTPSQASSAYQVHVRARSAWSSLGAEAISAAQAFPIQARVTAVTLTPNLASPQGLGATVTWTAAPSGGTAPYQYKWSVSDGSTSIILADWSSAAVYSWTPTVANGNYILTVKARSAGNIGSYEALADAAYAIKPRVTGLTMTADKAPPQVPNTAVAFTANATGGEAPLQYRWYVSDGVTTTMSDWGTNATFVWTPAQSNSAYQVHVRARSAWSSLGAEAISAAQAFSIQARVTAVTLTPNLASPQGLGATVTWTAAPTGGTAPYQYKWSVSDGSTSVILADWSSAAVYSWTPTVANASYVLTVKARSAGNIGSYEALTDTAYAIGPRVTGITMSADKASPQAQNTAITFTANATGGEAPLQYRWYVSDGVTTTMSNWGASATFVWTPAQANSAYQVHVRARSAWSSLGAEAISATQAFPIQ